jgi:hypothetical protein
VAYDGGGEGVTSTLVEPGSTEHDVTHMESRVAELEVLRSAGQDEVLRIEQPQTRTLPLE